MKNNIGVVIAVAIIFGAGGFYGGMKYQQTQRGDFMFQSANGDQVMMNSGQDQRPGGMIGGSPEQGVRNMRGGFRPVNGEIISQDEDSITVKLEDGSSKIVLVSDETSINKAAESSKADLIVGETVAVFGQENADGSVNAQNIQLNPQTQMRI